MDQNEDPSQQLPSFPSFSSFNYYGPPTGLVPAQQKPGSSSSAQQSGSQPRALQTNARSGGGGGQPSSSGYLSDPLALEHALHDFSQVMVPPDLVAPVPPQTYFRWDGANGVYEVLKANPNGSGHPQGTPDPNQPPGQESPLVHGATPGTGGYGYDNTGYGQPPSSHVMRQGSQTSGAYAQTSVQPSPVSSRNSPKSAMSIPTTATMQGKGGVSFPHTGAGTGTGTGTGAPAPTWSQMSPMPSTTNYDDLPPLLKIRVHSRGQPSQLSPTDFSMAGPGPGPSRPGGAPQAHGHPSRMHPTSQAGGPRPQHPGKDAPMPGQMVPDGGWALDMLRPPEGGAAHNHTTWHARSPLSPYRTRHEPKFSTTLTAPSQMAATDESEAARTDSPRKKRKVSSEGLMSDLSPEKKVIIACHHCRSKKLKWV
jgi:hemin uptake protein HemP